MTIKKYMVSAADVYGYNEIGDLLFVGKTLLDSSIETTLSNQDVRGGRGNALLYRYFHSAEMNIQISDAQWNLDYLAAAVGSDVKTGNSVFYEENVTLGAGGTGTVTYTPLAFVGSNLYGWVTLVNGNVEKVEFTGSNFTCTGSEDDIVCVRYYKNDSASRQLTIRSDYVPKVIHLVMEAQLCSSDVSTNVIGKVQIDVPKAQISGSFSISLTPDSVASTPLSATALKSELTGQGCGNLPVYATITEVIDSAHWYDNVTALAIRGGDFSLTHPTSRLLTVYAIPLSGAAFIPPVDDLTFTSSDASKATVNASGLVTTVAAGTTTLKVSITAKTSVDANVVLTVS